MEFAHPERLYGLYFLPLLVLLLVYGARRRRADLLRFTGQPLAGALAPGRSWRKALLKGTLNVMGFLFLIMALAGPRFGTHLVKAEREGIDLVIALDTSLSMLAEDMKPNRLERAKQEMIDLIKGLRGDRVGLVVFAGDAFALCPLTVDYDAALMFVRSVDVDIVPEPGTQVAKAIEKSIALFEQSERRDRAVILVTDGESHEGDPAAAAREAKNQRIRIYAIGIGNPAGELIPVRGTGGGIEGYKKDQSGETVLTRLDEQTLRQVAQASEGKYLPATRDGLELKVLYQEIAGMEQKRIKGEFVERSKDRFPFFIGAALLLFMLDVLLTYRGGRRSMLQTRPLHTGVAARLSILILPVLTAALLALPGPAAAKKVDRGKVKAGNSYYRAGQYDKALYLYRQALGDSLEPAQDPQGVLYNLGNTLHMMQQYPQALESYGLSLSEDTTLSGRMLYNRGNTLMKQGQLQDAVESYVQSLRYLPDDEDARHNLEVALRMLQQQQQQQQQQNDQQQNDQKQQQQQNQDNQQNQQQQQPDSTQQNQTPPDSTQQQPLDPEALEKLSKEDALRILQALEEQEKKLQKEKRKAALKRVRRKGKDW